MAANAHSASIEQANLEHDQQMVVVVVEKSDNKS
jgi:hypothetical protein